MNGTGQADLPGRGERPPRRLVVAAVAFAVTLAVQLTAYLWVLSAGAPTALALLLAATWAVLTAPVFAASGPGPSGVLACGAAVAAAWATSLAVLAAGSPALSWMGAGKIFVLFSAVALAQCAFVGLSRRRQRRYVLAALAALAVVIISAGPFWTNGAVRYAGQPGKLRIATVTVAVNPVFALAGCLARGAFLWHECPILYEFTVLGRDEVQMPVLPWFLTAGIYGLLAAALVLAGVLRGRRGRRRTGAPGGGG